MQSMEEVELEDPTVGSLNNASRSQRHLNNSLATALHGWMMLTGLYNDVWISERLTKVVLPLF